MGGLKRLFLRITPIITLICFICFGITHAFQQEGQPNITYLTHEVIAVDDNNTPNDLTDDTTIDNYTFDFESYRNNININILKRATTNVIDLQTYKENLNNFNAIWANGYQLGDGLQTIVNALLLIMNTFIITINVVILPIRLIAAILLTGISLVGINTNRETPIITTLNTFLDMLAIPQISVTKETEKTHDKLYGTSWTFYNNITITENTTINATFMSNNEVFDKITIINNPEIGPFYNTPLITYYKSASIGGPSATVTYRGSQNWLNENYKQITFANNQFTEEQCDTIANQLQQYATSTGYQLEEYLGSTWTYNNSIVTQQNSNYFDIEFYFHDGWTSAQYYRLTTLNNNGTDEIRYWIQNGQYSYFTIWTSTNGWADSRWQTLLIDNSNNFQVGNQNFINLQNFLYLNATKVT